MSVNLLEEPSRAEPASQPLHFGLAWSTVLTASSPHPQAAYIFVFFPCLSLCATGLVLKPVNTLKATPETQPVLNVLFWGMWGWGDRENPRIGG